MMWPSSVQVAPRLTAASQSVTNRRFGAIRCEVCGRSPFRARQRRDLILSESPNREPAAGDERQRRSIRGDSGCGQRQAPYVQIRTTPAVPGHPCPGQGRHNKAPRPATNPGNGCPSQPSRSAWVPLFRCRWACRRSRSGIAGKSLPTTVFNFAQNRRRCSRARAGREALRA